MALEVKLNSAGMKELLRSPGVQADLVGRARRIAASAGPGHVVDSDVGPNRARAAVITASRDAAINEAKNHTLLRALGAGG